MFKKVLVIVGALATLAVVIGVVWFAQQEQPSSLSLENFKAEASDLRILKEKWQAIIKEEGGEKAYAAFLEEAPTLALDTHSQAHAFGEALYEAEGLPGLKACDSSFEFGCYHSFFGVAVYNEGIESLPAFDEACKSKYGDMNLPCQHGIGHGVLVYTDYDHLEDALALCETISTLPTGGCSSGVFMEYNFHTMDNNDYIREVEGNLHEPCNSLPERFQASCYFEQVQWWQNVFDGDFKKIGELCAELPQDSAAYQACYNGAGNYSAAQAEMDIEKIIDLCAQMPDEQSRGLCNEGASWLIRADAQKGKEAEKLCTILNEPEKSQCLQKLNF